MSKGNQFLAIGSLVVILLIVIWMVVWQYVKREQSSSGPLITQNTCSYNWKQMPLDVAKNVRISLQGVVAISSKDIWVVGNAGIKHWNGTQWQPVLDEAVQQGTWTGITARSAHDIWTIGQGPAGRPQAAHWNGKSWKLTTISIKSADIVKPTGITAITAKNAWIVGSSQSGPNQQETNHTLILHWNGRSWLEVAGAQIPAGNDAKLTGISAVSAKDIWIVGNLVNTTTHAPKPLIEHWNGRNWQLIPSSEDHPSYHTVRLNAVTAVSSHDVWLVGSGFFSGDRTVRGTSGLIQHWDGKIWSYTKISIPESRSNMLASIKAISPTNVWAAGSFVNPNSRLSGAYMQHWDGQKWNIITWPRIYGQLANNTSVSITDISGTPDGQIIAVGASVVFTQNPPIGDAARNPTQPFILASCH
ncbi:hypothetical protein KDA_42150 [Dictyobacter alpinus]|uniref:Galactose oxidase n=1 Tax=Dictyobacter alpinus TaxID=2014873 RepID=A0A402BBC3_9CHLR|nr:hypothetical protein [Dictyobacter alpinus]GCE28731.1 hypothetical protein KDA_42150 [Dictyobacter alpinus]